MAKKATKTVTNEVTIREAYEGIGRLILNACTDAKKTGRFSENELSQLATIGDRFTAKGERLERQANDAVTSRQAKLDRIAKLTAEVDAL